jgi:hypothetical protein
MKLRFTYFTPDSTLPLVWARYARHSRGSKPQCRKKLSKVGFHFAFSAAGFMVTVRIRS